MDKFFIQAAFKTLDDIDKEENKEIKKALIESRLKEAERRNKRSQESLKEDDELKEFNVIFHDGPYSDRKERLIIKAHDSDEAMEKAYDLPQAIRYKYVAVCKRAEGKVAYMVAFEYNYVFRGKVESDKGEGYIAFNANNESEARRAYNKKYLGKYFRWLNPGRNNIQEKIPTDVQGGKYGNVFDVYQIGSKSLPDVDDAQAIVNESLDEDNKPGEFLDEAKKKKTKKYPLGKGEHLNPCAGNPDINIAVFNHAANVGASSPTTGLGEDNEGKYTVRRYGRWHYIIINPENGLALRVGDKVDYEKPESPDNRILFFKSKDEAQKYIDQELPNSKSLEEKLPKDLSTAYKNTKVYARRDTFSPERDISRPHKRTPYDYENSDYKEITKEEALKYRNKPKERYRLRVIINTSINQTSNDPHVVIFNKDGKVISDFEVLTRMFPTARRFKNSWSNIRYYSFTDIINAAYKIYETDEDSHPNKEAEERANLLTSFDSYGSSKYEL